MINRRSLMAMAGALAAQGAIARAAAIDAKVKTGTIKDVQHVVVLMQENRGFDHYFGALNGVRGFADRFPIPLPGGRTVWTQSAGQRALTPFPLDTSQAFELMRIEGTPHNWADAQAAWDHGRMSRWPQSKTDRTMAHYRPQDLPFQVALADAFTICDAYHCSFQGGTNTNRLFLFTGANDPLAKGGGPAISNSHDSLPGPKDPYHWTTYVERLQAAGVSWRLYQDMADNFSDNPMVGFKAFREALAGAPGSSRALAERAMSSRSVDQLRSDVIAGTLPQVSYMISTAAESEHPGPSSPAQGADYTARVIEALTANPEVWSRTALLIMFDENDGFFDHIPPPAPPSRLEGRALAGASTVDTSGEYHINPAPGAGQAERPELMGRPYGLGPRAPMYVVSPWSRGGYVNSQVFDHTSVIQFLERRFGVMEPNISAWRRSVSGDLTSAFDFKTPNSGPARPLPATRAGAERAKAITRKTNPPTPIGLPPPVQAPGPRPSRALPYDLEAQPTVSAAGVVVRFANTGGAGAVFHVYDRQRLDAIPRRYTVEPGKVLLDEWPAAAAAAHDLWILGPNGFHRHVRGLARNDTTVAALEGDPRATRLKLTLVNPGAKARALKVAPQAYGLAPWTVVLAPGKVATNVWPLASSRGWYDLLLTCEGEPAFSRRFAGRLETGKDSVSDPAMSGPATMAWSA